jgi:hypothetical protein
MPPEFDPFAEDDSSTWVDNATPRARRADDDAYLMDHESTPDRTMNGQHQLAAATPSGLQSPTPSTIVAASSGNSTSDNTNIELYHSNTAKSRTAQQPALTIDEDNEDDFTIITADRASPEAQAKWSRFQPNSHNNGNFVKLEPIDVDQAPAILKKLAKPPTDFNKIMDAQRVLWKDIQNNNTSNRSTSIFGSRSRTPNPFQNEAESSASASRGFVPDSPRLANYQRNDPQEVDTAMRDRDEDHSWMHDDFASDDDEYETLKTLYTSLSKKEKESKITPNERMELFKLEKTLQMKMRLKAAAAIAEKADEDTGSLFVQESREDIVNRHRRNRPHCNSDVSEDDEMAKTLGDGDGDVDGGDDDTMMKILQQELNGDGLDKPRKKRAKNAREYAANAEESRRQKERSKAQRKKGRIGVSTSRSKPAIAKGKGKGKGKASTSKKKGKKGTVKNGESLLRSTNISRYSGIDDVGKMMLEDLMTNDPISDRLQNPIFNTEPEVPMPGKHVKESQFQMLFANIPVGDGSKANAKSIKNDKKALKEASRSFGYAKVRAQDGKWVIKGMTSTLYHHQLLGAQWMVQRELSSQPPHGGLLADSMG